MDEQALPIETDVPLAALSTLGVGGRSRWFARATRPEQIAAAHQWTTREGVPLFVLGGGSNVVIADEGWQGLALEIAVGGVRFDAAGDETVVQAGAGEPWDRLVADVVARGHAGIECLSGIPGRVGGTPIQNVGAYGQEVAHVIESVTAWDRHAADFVVLGAASCGFAYRTSRFKTGKDAGRFIISEVEFRLRRGDPTTAYPDVAAELQAIGITAPTVGDVRRAVLAVRRRKGMVLDPSDPDTHSVGSFFTNPVVTRDVRERIASRAGRPVPGFDLPGGLVKIPAAWLIERSGLDRAIAVGGAAVSSKHPLALVNRGGARARDILDLAVLVKRRVLECFEVPLRPEPVFIGFGDDPALAFLQE